MYLQTDLPIFMDTVIGTRPRVPTPQPYPTVLEQVIAERPLMEVVERYLAHSVGRPTRHELVADGATARAIVRAGFRALPWVKL
jgi:hypothetical protein